MTELEILIEDMDNDEYNKLYQILRNSGYLTRDQCDKLIELIGSNFNIKLKGVKNFEV